MKRFFTFTCLICLGAILSVSCLKSDYVIYGDQAMVDVVNGELVTDADITYNVQEDETDGKWKEEKRIYILNDILSKGEKGRYNIRLKKYVEVLVQDAIKDSNVTDEEAGNDTTFVESIWLASHDRINILADFPSQNKENQDTFTVTYDDVNSTKEKLIFTVRRNSHGDSISTKDIKLNSNKFDREQVFLTISFKEFLFNANSNAQIIVVNGSNKAGNN